MRALVEEDAPLALGVFPDDELAAEELEGGGHGGIEILDERDGVPVIAPHEGLLAVLLLLLILLAGVLLERGRHAHARLAVLLGRVRVHGRPRRRREGHRHCGRLPAAPLPRLHLQVRQPHPV